MPILVADGCCGRDMLWRDQTIKGAKPDMTTHFKVSMGKIITPTDEQLRDWHRVKTRRWSGARTAFAEMVAKCPVPVVMGPTRSNCYIYDDMGEYPALPGDPPAPYITLFRHGALAARASLLLHEIGHHICRSSGCECFSDKWVANGLCEAHAYEFSLRECLRLRLPAAHCEAVRVILSGAWWGFFSPRHRLGANMVLRSATWASHLRLASVSAATWTLKSC